VGGIDQIYIVGALSRKFKEDLPQAADGDGFPIPPVLMAPF
jgi:hypothetical protein